MLVGEYTSTRERVCHDQLLTGRGVGIVRGRRTEEVYSSRFV